MHRILLHAFTACLVSSPISAQWVGGGIFSTVLHFQASAFQDPDTGLFVYGGGNPGNDEGGIIATFTGNVGGGYYLWYQSAMILEDIDVRWSGGVPHYMAAGSQQYGTSVIVRATPGMGNPFQFDSVRTGYSQYYRAVRMRSDLVAFAGGGNYLGNGIIDMSTDTGTTWTNVTVLPGQPVSRLHFVNDQLGFAATGGYRRLFGNGVQIPDSGAVYRTIDGGLTWQQVLADTVTGFSDVAFSSVTNGAATRNDGVIMRTVDGGDTWAPAVVNLAPPLVMTTVTFRPDGTGFAGAYRADGTSGYILISTDGGANWYQNFSTSGLNNSRRIYDLYFYDDVLGVASTHIKPLMSNGLITGVHAVAAPSFDLFPNPAEESATLTLEAPMQADIDVLDVLGRPVLTTRANGDRTVELPVEDLSPGRYTVRVRSAAGEFCRALVRM